MFEELWQDNKDSSHEDKEFNNFKIEKEFEKYVVSFSC